MKEALVLHHDEADGLASAALAKLAVEHLGLKTRLICIDKLYPEVVAGVEQEPARVIVYSDIGSSHIDWLIKHNAGKNLIITLDHHDTIESTDPSVLNLNPELDNFSGEKEASSATVAYLFGKTVDPELRRFGHLALVGSMEVPGEPRGLNEIIAKEAEEEKLARRSGRDFSITVAGTELAPTLVVDALNVLGPRRDLVDGSLKRDRGLHAGLRDQ